MTEEITKAPGHDCERCPVWRPGALKKLGLNMDAWDFVIALAGNPNTGKSTVFNALTGLHQHTGNWPGKTISRAEGGFSYSEKRYKIVDLPGTYSLRSTSTDEQVAREFILFGQPDVTVIVCDATSLERNFNLLLQVRQITGRVVVALNLIDEARSQAIKIDTRNLARELGVPVVPMSARSKEGLPDLLKEIHLMATQAHPPKPRPASISDPSLARALIWTICNVDVQGVSVAAWSIRALDPIAWPLGLTGIILLAYVVAIPANEIVIPTILMLTVMSTGIQVDAASGAGVMFETSDNGVLFALLSAGGWTTLTAVCLMLFSLCHNPCSTTLYTIYRETGSMKWTVWSAVIPTVMGIVLCAIVATIWRLFV
jgi:ferrous iron transport protein B